MISPTFIPKKDIWKPSPGLQRRIRGTVAFIRKYGWQGEILDIGEWNLMAESLRVELNAAIMPFPEDVDHVSLHPIMGYWHTITCFEVIEHLYNPLFALENMKRVLEPGGCIYLSTPIRPFFLRGKHHFHEIDDKRLGWLFDRAGLKVVAMAKINCRESIWWHLQGVRPMLRFFCTTTRIYKLEIADVK